MYSVYATDSMLDESLFYLHLLGMNEKSVSYTVSRLQHFIEVSRKSSMIFPHVTDTAVC